MLTSGASGCYHPSRCLRRVESRVGHGFTDLDAARHMYAQFAEAPVDARHVISTPDVPAAPAARLHRSVRDGSILPPIER